MFSQAFEEGAHRLDMRYRIGIEHNDIVEVSRQLLKSLITSLITMEWPRKFASVARNRALEGECFRLCFRRRSKRERIV